MWCSACQQDVPGVVASANDLTICCTRCGNSLANEAPEPSTLRFPTAADKDHHGEAAGGGPVGEGGELPEFVELEGWDLEETLKRADRLVRCVRGTQGRGSNQHRQTRVDSAHHFPNEDQSDATGLPSPPLKAVAQPTSSVAWIVLALGLAVFVCGAALMGLSFLYQRAQLWQLGLPMVLGGQVAVLAVVIWQLESVWQSNRATFVALHAMDEHLREIHREFPTHQSAQTTGDQSPNHCGTRL